MLMADDRSNVWSSEEGLSYNEENDSGDGFSIGMDELLGILENPSSSEMVAENSTFNHEGFLDFEVVPSSGADSSGMFSPLYNIGSSEFSTGISDVSENAGRSFVSNDTNLDFKLQLAYPVQSSPGSLTDWIPAAGCGHLYLDKDIVSRNASMNSLQDGKEMGCELPNCSKTFSFPSACFSNNTAGNTESSNIDHLNYGSELQFTFLDSKYSSGKQLRKENRLNLSTAAPKVEGYTGMKIDLSDDSLGYGNQYLRPFDIDMVAPSYGSNQFTSYTLGKLPDVDSKMTDIKKAEVDHLAHSKSSNSRVAEQIEMLDDVGAEVPMSDEHAAGIPSDPNFGVDYASFSNFFPTYNCNDDFTMKQETHMNAEKENGLTASLLDNDVIDMKPFGDATGLSPGEVLKLSSSGFPESKRPRLSPDDYDGTTSGMPTIGSVVHDHYLDSLDIKSSGGSMPSAIKQQFTYTNLNRDSGPSSLMVNGCHIVKMNGQKVQSDLLVQSCDSDNDADLRVLEDISGPAGLNISTVNGKSPVASQPTVVCSSLNPAGVGPIKLKPTGEHHIFQAALQDLCQQQTEDTPPNGFMAVPLLKHQRIALSWMVRKEKPFSSSGGILGGILADDQGLGKTISTIALILKERSPSALESVMKQNEPETLNLDDDDDNDRLLNVEKSKQGGEPCQVNGCSSGRKSTSMQEKRKPAAGTLIVCPTSVLRQWSEELQNKVTSKANLSVLVYHGSNRTKDSHELAKYDVVLTTYAIVSMEVPKKPLVDDDDDVTKGTSDSPLELSSFKKRKYPPHSSKKSSKSKKSVDADLLDIRPLAGVRWFRVVLDEAQSIKNHRTQVARACWGLRAKRRWCLSGTPMQNAVDDLYSYFRFLKLDPYSAYKDFCSLIKLPIHRNLPSGYKRLQVVLGTIMLRRTKATLIDGEPIINLPPKTIKMYKVDFTPEERDFYQTLEADSRAQFAEYAAAGTVQKNYVNILLMLLRLRQACDHPLLVKGFNSRSKSISSVEMVKKIPREKQLHLMQCYEASLSICGMCRDPPEDAVVTICGHIFCSQCIYEHLSGDDTHCPATNCKTHLKEVAVFSVAALRCSLFDQPTPESTPDCSRPKFEETSGPPSLGCAYDSSKIKAALEVLQSLNKQEDYKRTSSPCSVEEGTPAAEHASGLHSSGLCECVCNEKNKRRGEPCRGSVGEKAIVFSQWTRMLDLLEVCLKDSSIQYRRLDGTMSVVARDKAVKDFNTLPEVSVMIMSLKAASLGLNMVAACHVLMLDLWWNPTTEDQAIDRAHRIGQTRPVTVLRLTVKDTVEDRILALQQKKREMVASAFGEDDSGTRNTRLTVEDLNYLFS